MSNSSLLPPSSATLPPLPAVLALLARRRLAEFVKSAWPILSPARPLEWAPYLDAICLHLEAVSRRDPRVRRLLISQPPNTLKSTIVSVCWPAWVWVEEPATRFLFAANDGPLATRDALLMRELTSSRWYVESFGPKWTLKDDQDVKTWYANTAGGHRISYSVNARVTGKKGDILVVDDANDAKKVHSEAERRTVIDWHDLAFSGRTADERSSPEVVVGQRLHRDDLIGHLSRKGGWAELRLAEEFDPANVCETPLWRDHRTRAGEFLRPGRFGEAEKADAVARLGPAGYEGQHNQDPREIEGTWFDRDKVKPVAFPPPGTVAVRYWDTAASEGRSACHTAGVLLGRAPDGRFVILDVVCGKWGPLERNQKIVATAHADRHTAGVRVSATWVEQEPGGSGLEAAQALIRQLAGFNAKADKVTGPKDERIKPFAAQWQAGNVLYVEGSWVEGYFAELATVPGGRKRDQADASAGAFNKLTDVPVGDSLPFTAPVGETIFDQLPRDTFM